MMAHLSSSPAAWILTLILPVMGALPIAAFAHGPGESFTVQVGAYKLLDPSLLEKLQQFGDVKSQSAGAYTRVLVGELRARDSAEALRQQLIAAGYNDAFVRQVQGEHKHIGSQPAATDLSALEKLPPEDRAAAVYLDGVLHLKRGDEFIPIP